MLIYILINFQEHHTSSIKQNTNIYFYRTRVLAEYSITSYIYVTESVRTTAEVCVVMTEEVWVPQSLTDEAMDQNAPSKLEQTCISGLPWATSLKG